MRQGALVVLLASLLGLAWGEGTETTRSIDDRKYHLYVPVTKAAKPTLVVALHGFVPAFMGWIVGGAGDQMSALPSGTRGLTPTVLLSSIRTGRTLTGMQWRAVRLVSRALRTTSRSSETSSRPWPQQSCPSISGESISRGIPTDARWRSAWPRRRSTS